MATIAVLGAGYMGGALTVPASDNGHQVRLWGTWLDDALIRAIEARLPHPRLGIRLPGEVLPFYSGELAAVLDRADLVISAVTSEGIVPVMERAMPLMAPGALFASATKGLALDARGRVERLSQAVARMAPADFRYIHVAGPCKATELARRVPTAVFYASESVQRARDAATLMATSYYRIEPSADLAGSEICSALKNAYAIALGFWDGLERAGRVLASYNAKSAAFTKAIRELELIVEAAGGRSETGRDLPGMGDLLVTSLSGRNRALGELIGFGEQSPAEAVWQMAERGQATEGYPAVRAGWALVRQLAQQGALDPSRCALLGALHAVLYEGAPVWETMQGLDWL